MSTDAADVVIVGSGPIGATFARMLSDHGSGLDIRVLDAGPLLAEPPGVNVRNLEDPDAQQVARRGAEGPGSAPSAADAVPVAAEGTVTARDGTYLVDPGSEAMPAAAASSCVGGMGALWTCAVPEPRDSERIAFIEPAQWRSDLAIASRLLARTSQAFSDSVHVAAIRDRVAGLFDPILPRDRPVSILPVAGVPRPDGSLRWAGADTVLGDATFRLEPDSLACELLVSGNEVRGVRVRDTRSGDERELHARAVVVAAGSWNTPQLLWASGIRPPALGHYLTEHPLTFSVLALGEEIAAATGHAPIPHGIDPVAGVVHVPFADPGHPFHAQVMHMDVPMFPVDLSSVNVTSAGFVSMGWGCRKHPRFEDAVTFDDAELDGYGLPRPRIAYALTDAEHRELDIALEHLTRAAEALGEYVPGGQPRRMPAGTSLHYQGTVRAGDDDGEQSVCDSFSQVWGMRNLFVGGNGVIPTATTCNPTLTSVTLAVRASRRVMEVIG